MSYTNFEMDKPNYKWLTFIIGIFSIAVGIISLMHPIITIDMLTLLFIIFFLGSGISQIVYSFSNWKITQRFIWIFIDGIINIVFAIIMIVLPSERIEIFIYFISFFVLFQGIITIFTAFAFTKLHPNVWGWYVLTGIIGCVLGAIMLIQPKLAQEFISIIFALSFITYGVYKILFASNS